jgi:type I restriction enzyme M protein
VAKAKNNFEEFHNEEEVKIKFLLPELNKLGYETKDLEFEKELPITIGGKVLHPKADVVIKIKETYPIVIETKNPREPLIETSRDQVLSYAKLLRPSALFAVLTNGRLTDVYDIHKEILLGHSLRLLPSKDRITKLILKAIELPKDVIDEAIRVLITFNDIKEFARVFDRCHNIIRTQKGLDARGRLYEMCKILLIKLYEEKIKSNRFSIRAVEEAEREFKMDGNEFMNAIFDKDIKKEFGALFEKDEHIILTGHTIKEIVGLLEVYSLSKTREDILGVAFETFLKKTMTGRELGEFFTPREVVDFMVSFINPTFGERLLDPASGSGGFLINTFFHILQQLECSKKTDEEKEQIKEKTIEDCLWGMDIDSYLVNLCKINLKVHGDGYEHIYRSNSIDVIDDPVETENKTTRDEIKEILEKEGGFDIILTNPPFGSGQDRDITEEKLLRKYESGKNQNSSVKNRQTPQILFTELCIKLLKQGGRLGIVLPDGILGNPSENDYIKIRELIKKYTIVKAVIGLPQGTFIPYGSGVKASILFLEKRIEGDKQEEIFMANADYIGFRTNTQRYIQTPENDLPLILETYRKFEKKQQFTQSHLGFIVNPKDTDYRMDSYYHDYRFTSVINKLRKKRHLALKDVASSPVKGRATRNYKKSGFPVIRIGNIIKIKGIYFLNITDLTYISEQDHKKAIESKIQTGDILFAITGATIGKVAIVPPKIEEANICSDIVRLHIDKKKINPYYVLTFLNSNDGQIQILKQIYGSTNKHLDIDGLKTIIIPLDPNYEKLAMQLKNIEKLQVKMDLALDELCKFVTPLGIKIR